MIEAEPHHHVIVIVEKVEIVKLIHKSLPHLYVEMNEKRFTDSAVQTPAESS